MKEHIYYCDFCGKSQDELEVLVVGLKEEAICNECIPICAEIIELHKRNRFTAWLFECFEGGES
jgi:ATP-dependent protease Clp ATPase subunit